MRRPVALVFLTAAALTLTGCGQVGGSGGRWSPKAGSGDDSTPTSSPDDDALATCLEGTWDLDEATTTVLASMVADEIVAGLAGEQTDDVTVELTSVTASQTIVFDDDKTFSATTVVDVEISMSATGTPIPATIGLEVVDDGTWRVDDDEMAATTLDSTGTMTLRAPSAGLDESEETGDDLSDLVLLPPTLEPAVCRGDRLAFEGAGAYSSSVPDDLVFNRR